MESVLPNLFDLVERLPEGSLARELAEACEGCESMDELRETLSGIIAIRLEAEKARAGNAEGTVDRD